MEIDSKLAFLFINIEFIMDKTTKRQFWNKFNSFPISSFDILIRISMKGRIFSIPPNKLIFLSYLLLIITLIIFTLSEIKEKYLISKLLINRLLLS